MADTPEATAVEAQQAANAAQEAERAAAAAIANAANVAAEAERAAALRTEQTAQAAAAAIGAQEENLLWLRNHANETNSRLETLATENQTLRTELTQQRETLGPMAEALQRLLTPPAQEQPTETIPPEIPPSAGADAPKDQPTQPGKRRVIKI